MEKNLENSGNHLFDSIRRPLRIVLIYLAFGGMWIIFSDSLLGYLVKDADLLIRISTLKGWIYVAVTGMLLLKLIHKDFSQIQSLNSELFETNQELVGSNEEIRALYEEMAASEEALQESFEELQDYREKLEASDERYQLVMRASQEGFWDYRVSEGRLEVSEGFSRIFDAQWNDSLGLADEIATRVHPEDRIKLAPFMGAALDMNNTPFTHEIRVLHSNGSYRWVQFQGLPIFDDTGKPHRIIGAITDIHDKFLQRERIEYYAFHDPSTGFYNRDFMLEQLSKLYRNHGSSSGSLGFLVAGVYGMERLVSVYGTNISEIIHYQVGMRIREAVDPGTDIAMLGLGRFGFILHDAPDNSYHLWVDAINRLMKEPIRIYQLVVRIQMVYGAVLCNTGMCEPEIIVQQAETALAHGAKERSLESIIWHNPSFQAEQEYQGKIEFMLSRALDAGEFTLVFQPQLEEGDPLRLMGHEALIRWNSLELGPISPEVFIPIAESAGLIDGIGIFVIEGACRFLKAYTSLTGSDSKVSINCSLIELMDSGYIHRLVTIVEKHEVRPEQICIEITESALAKYLDLVVENLTVLREKGFEIHLDDFGTGYSSLNHLGRLPVNAVKIDRSFVWQMEGDSRMSQMTALIIQAGHSLNLKIIAEGVETETQHQLLKGMGCDSYQGYYFSRPIPGEVLLKGSTAMQETS